MLKSRRKITAVLARFALDGIFTFGKSEVDFSLVFTFEYSLFFGVFGQFLLKKVHLFIFKGELKTKNE